MLINKISLSVLEERYKKEQDGKVKQRLHILLLLREGYTQREVSAMTHTSVGIVPFWKARFEKEGFDGLQDKEGRGVKAQITDEELSMVRSAIEEPLRMSDGYSRGWTSKDVRIFLNEQFSHSFTRQHVCKILHLIGCSLQVPRPRNKSRNEEDVRTFKKDFKKNFNVWAGM